MLKGKVESLSLAKDTGWIRLVVSELGKQVSQPTTLIQGDSKPLRQTLRVDRANNKEHFLSNTLFLLACGFKVNTSPLLWFHFYSAGWKKSQEVFKMCALYLITLVTSSCHWLSDSGEHAWTVSYLISFFLNWWLHCTDTTQNRTRKR